jgi:hypothetical protein
MAYTLFDVNGKPFEVDSIVHIPVKVTAIVSTPLSPDVQRINVETIYANTTGTKLTISNVFANTVVNLE